MIQFSNVELRRGGHVLLQDVSLAIHPGWRVGLTGVNGSGKSSVLAALRGEMAVDAGQIDCPPAWVIAHLPQEVEASPRPALEYVLDGDAALRSLQQRLHDCEDGVEQGRLYAEIEAIDGWTAEARARQLLAGLGFAPHDPERPVADFSGGWRMRLGLARTLMTRSDLLLLDEPTNHLDFETILWLEQWLARYPGTLLVIAHDRRFLDQVVTHIAHIEQQGIQLFTGGYTAAERRRAEILAQSEAAAVRIARERAHLEKFVNRFRAKATKARQAQSRLKRLEKLDEIALVRATRRMHWQIPAPARLPDPLLRLDGVTVGEGEARRLQPVSISLRPEDRIGILGPNGAGKSTLLSVLSGDLIPTNGERHLDPEVVVGYFAQHQREQLDDSASPLLHLQRQMPEALEQSLRNLLGHFGFSGARADQPVQIFSGGERVRLVLALLVARAPGVLLLDEPTNHLDLEMREALAEALESYTGAMVLVSHDRELLERVCDRFWRVRAGRVEVYEGDLEDYTREVSQVDESPSLAQTPLPAVHQAREKRQLAAQQREALRPLQKVAAGLESRYSALQADLVKLEQALADPDLYTTTTSTQVADLLKQQGQLRQELEMTEVQWLEALEAVEQARLSG